MKIDFVILWVDGNDPDWQAEKNVYAQIDPEESSLVNRYRDWGLLPYWFRAVDKFAPWVHKIHFVTWGHVPPFLNIRNPKLHIVNHRDFIPSRYLPTFNSHAIEMNIHRIPELSEHFVYFNDDMFLLRPVKPEDFFRKGLPCTCGSEKPMELRGNPGAWIHAAVNDLFANRPNGFQLFKLSFARGVGVSTGMDFNGVGAALLGSVDLFRDGVEKQADDDSRVVQPLDGV